MVAMVLRTLNNVASPALGALPGSLYCLQGPLTLSETQWNDSSAALSMSKIPFDSWLA